MTWFTAWWQQLRGHILPVPWEHDPEIVSARRDQHRRLNHAAALLARDGLAIRKERIFWQRWGDGSKKHDDG